MRYSSLVTGLLEVQKSQFHSLFYDEGHVAFTLVDLITRQSISPRTMIQSTYIAYSAI